MRMIKFVGFAFLLCLAGLIAALPRSASAMTSPLGLANAQPNVGLTEEVGRRYYRRYGRGWGRPYYRRYARPYYRPYRRWYRPYAYRPFYRPWRYPYAYGYGYGWGGPGVGLFFSF